MSRSTLGLAPAVQDYLVAHGVREDRHLAALRDATASLPMARMQISAEQGSLLQLLVRLLDARRCLEVGTFTGYSAMAVVQAMPPDGRLVACDVSEEWTAIARDHWARAGVAGRIDLRLAPALQTLDALLADGQAGTFDLAFIDADKENYAAYYDRCLALLRPGGLVAIDNVLWSGAVADPADTSPSTVALRALNARVIADPRVDVSMVPISDGLTLARKRPTAVSSG